MCIPGMETALLAALTGSGAAAGTAGATAGTLGTVLKAGAGAVTAISQFANMRAMSKAAERNAAFAQEQARETIEQGQQESDLRRRAGAKLQGENLVAMAANGLDVTSPHALDVLNDSQSAIEQDAFRIRTNSLRQAKSISQQAANYGAEAASYKSASIMQPISTVLSTGATVAERYAPWHASRKYPGTSSAVMAGGY